MAGVVQIGEAVCEPRPKMWKRCGRLSCRTAVAERKHLSAPASLFPHGAPGRAFETGPLRPKSRYDLAILNTGPEATGLIARREESLAAGPPQTRKKYLREDGPGLIGSVLLHVLAAIAVLLLLSKTGLQSASTVTRFLPVDIVQLDKDGDAASPLEQHRSLILRQQSFHVPVVASASPRPVGAAPLKTRAPVDELQAKLQSLAKLRQPDTALVPLENSPQASADSTSPDAAAGDDASYGVKDLIRAQVERRWLLDLTMLGKRDFRIPIHVEVTRDGKVLLAEIVDKKRYNADAAYREIALSARNAIILSSPFALPPNYYKDVTDITLNLDPRDALR